MSEKQEELFQIYLEEIRELESLTEEQNQELLLRLAQGEDAARDRLIEGNLKEVLKPVGNYLNRGLAAEDLVQEANMALLEAVSTWQSGSFHAYLAEQTELRLKKAVEDQDTEGKIRANVLDRVEKLKKAAEELAERFGRQATLQELAERLGLTVEDIQDGMKDILNAMDSSEGQGPAGKAGDSREEADPLLKEAFRIADEEDDGDSAGKV